MLPLLTVTTPATTFCSGGQSGISSAGLQLELALLRLTTSAGEHSVLLVLGVVVVVFVVVVDLR